MHKTDRINWALLLPLLVCGALIQITVPLARVFTTYAALDLDLPPPSLGLLSSAFALLPVFLAIRIGRHNDARGEGGSLLLGATLVLGASPGLTLVARELVMLLVFTTMLGIGQVLVIAALQTATTRCSPPALQDKVLGNFLLATSLGQALGPLFIPLTTPAGALTPGSALIFVICAAGVLLLGSALAILRQLPAHSPVTKDEALSLRGLLRVRGLVAIIIASGLTVTANDLMLVFFPAFGAARGIEAGVVGVLLSVRAVASISSRVLFARLARLFGKPMLLRLSMIVGSLALLGLLFELPIWAIGALLACSGFAAGMATASSISLALTLAPPGMRSTTVSLRLTANRLGQFIIPLVAGSATAIIGPAGVFLLAGAAMGGSALSLISRRGRRNEE